VPHARLLSIHSKGQHTIPLPGRMKGGGQGDKAVIWWGFHEGTTRATSSYPQIGNALITKVLHHEMAAAQSTQSSHTRN